MKLSRIRIEQWRQFRAPLLVDDLQLGINLFAGPNESGKSTVVEAIQAAFFERHKSGTVSHFQPWDDSAAEPAVELTFDWQGQTWQLHKRFLGHARCDLTVDGSSTSGDDAEDRLTQLMGYSLASRGTSKPEHHGIPGLLWVRQGTLQDIRAPVQHAATHLQTALGQDLGSITSSSGDWLLAEVTKERAKLLTPTGRATGAYKEAEAALATRSSQLKQLEEQLATYEEKVDTLARLHTERTQIDATQPWRAQRKQAEEARARLQQVEQLEAQQQQTRHELAHCSSQQELLHKQLQAFDHDDAQLAERVKAHARAQETLDGLQSRRQAVEAQQRQAKVAYDAAENTLQQARQQARHQRIQAGHQQLQAALDRQQKTQATLTQLQQDLRSLSAQRQQQAMDAGALKKLQHLQKQLDQIALRKQVAATRIRWQLQPGQGLTLGAAALQGSGEQLLLQATDLTIPGVGHVQITPGGKDAGALAREETRLAGDRALLLAELGVHDVAEAEARAASHQRLQADITLLQTRIRDLAPEGVDAFMQQLQDDQAQLATLARQIAACPPMPDGLPTEEDAEHARNAASNALQAADTALQQHLENLGLAQQAFDTAQTERQRLQTTVHGTARQQAQQAASQGLTEQKALQSTLQAQLAQRQEQINAAQPGVLRDDIERFSTSADALEEAARSRQRHIDRLQTELQTLGAQGLADQRGELQQAVDALQRRQAQLAARARALDLLLTLLQEQRQALTRRLQAPLQKHLAHYLQLLFPGAHIQVDEHLVPTLLQRAGQHGAFDDLSYGAREQLGLISRLAYADLLQEAGRPTLIILDDALVHADAQRLAHMKRILYDAAKRHQVLLFTCHPVHWNDLGVPAHDLPTFKATKT